jgi:DNA-binding HxlR family transcriptional regulator
MTLDKFALVFDTGLRKISARLGCPILGHHELGLLVLLKRRTSLRFGQLQYLIGKYGKSNDPSYVANSLRSLVDSGLVLKESAQYTISPLGREYLSALRNYLRNYRL